MKLNFNIKFEGENENLQISINNGVAFKNPWAAQKLTKESILNKFATEVIEINQFIYFPSGAIFHKSFVDKYRGLNIVAARRICKWWGNTRSTQDKVISYLKSNKIISC